MSWAARGKADAKRLRAIGIRVSPETPTRFGTAISVNPRDETNSYETPTRANRRPAIVSSP